MELAPVLLFTYKRLDLTKMTLSALQQNFLADESELFIFSDGPKTVNESLPVKQIREYLGSVKGFKKVTLYESEENKGLAASIISGVTKLIDEYGRVIVLEDDLVTSRNFLSFSNQALRYYQADPKVFSVGGYTRPISGLSTDDIYFTRRASSWGWATWKERWDKVDWDVKDYDQFRKNRVLRRAFNRMGSDMAGMLDKQMRGEINSWAIRWCYHQFKNNLVTVFPATSKVRNIGFNESASHTKGKFNSFGTVLDETNYTDFVFSDNLVLDEKVIKQFVKPYSIPERIRNKILNALPSL